MKKILLSAAITTGLAATAWASSDVDANGDGFLTLDEVQAIYPEITAESFSAMDANADGALDQTEVTAAQEAGLMPATDG